MLDVSKPTPLRLAGFLATAVGGAVVALVAVQTWVRVTPHGDAGNDPVAGTDIVQGKVALAIGVTTLLAIFALRLLGSVGARQAVAIAILAGGLTAAGLAFSATTNLRDRYVPVELDAIARGVAKATGLSLQEARDRVRAEIDQESANWIISLEPWPWVGVGSGLLAAVGGLLDLVWVRRERLEWMQAAEPS